MLQPFNFAFLHVLRENLSTGRKMSREVRHDPVRAQLWTMCGPFSAFCPVRVQKQSLSDRVFYFRSCPRNRTCKAFGRALKPAPCFRYGLVRPARNDDVAAFDATKQPDGQISQNSVQTVSEK
jgi:hypothetical protein